MVMMSWVSFQFHVHIFTFCSFLPDVFDDDDDDDDDGEKERAAAQQWQLGVQAAK